MNFSDEYNSNGDVRNYTVQSQERYSFPVSPAGNFWPRGPTSPKDSPGASFCSAFMCSPFKPYLQVFPGLINPRLVTG